MQYLIDNDINLLLEDYGVLSIPLKKPRKKTWKILGLFHEENFQTNNDKNKGKHYLISDTITYIKQCYVFVDQDLSWQTVCRRKNQDMYNQMVKYFI